MHSEIQIANIKNVCTTFKVAARTASTMIYKTRKAYGKEANDRVTIDQIVCAHGLNSDPLKNLKN